MCKKLKYIAVLFALAGCAAPRPVAVPLEVNEPVTVACNAHPPARPRWNLPQVAASADAAEKLKAALADLELGKGYIVELEAALAACG